MFFLQMNDLLSKTAKNTGKGKEKIEEDGVMSSEWVAEEEQGVLITFISLPTGGNYLKKIRFR